MVLEGSLVELSLSLWNWILSPARQSQDGVQFLDTAGIWKLLISEGKHTHTQWNWVKESFSKNPSKSLTPNSVVLFINDPLCVYNLVDYFDLTNSEKLFKSIDRLHILSSKLHHAIVVLLKRNTMALAQLGAKLEIAEIRSSIKRIDRILLINQTD